jgi:hypothetical protein
MPIQLPHSRTMVRVTRVDYRRKSRPAAAASSCGPGILVERIISGGQTGVDRAALDFAIEHGIPHGGWCPRGRRAEDGEIQTCYELKETPDANYAERTEWNVRDSDGTLIISEASELSGGSALTRDLAVAHGKPWLHVSKVRDGQHAPEQVRRFIETHGIRVLNVAGPRLSTEPAARAFASRLLEVVFAAGS